MKRVFLVILALIAVPAFIGALSSNPGGSAAPVAAPAAATATTPPKADLAFERLRFAAIGVAELHTAMRNPESFKLEQILEMPKGAICYEYRAQNGFGGMNVEHAVMVDGMLKGGQESAASWHKNCAGKTGRDITDKVQELISFAKTNS
jgi:hypothetical protein